MSVPDLVIAGGGPAGLMTAIEARRSGLSATILEPATPPIDRPCGEGLMPEAVAALREIGIEAETLGGRPFHGICYVDGTLVAEGRFSAGTGWGVRRPDLHAGLAARAKETGVDLRWGVKVVGLAPSGFETTEGVVNGRWLVGADGRNSSVRKWAGLEGRRPRRRRFGVRRHYEIEPWSDLVEVHWHNVCEAYCTPVGHRMVGVAMLWSGGTATFDELLAFFPNLKSRLAGAKVVSRDRGAGPLERRCKKVFRGQLALVGDASGYVDAISGEGLALAFQQAGAVVGAIRRGDLSRYAAEHRKIRRLPVIVVRLLLLLEHHPILRRRVIRALAADSTLMSRFLELKVSAKGSRFIGSDGLLWLTAAALKG